MGEQSGDMDRHSTRHVAKLSERVGELLASSADAADAEEPPTEPADAPAEGGTHAAGRSAHEISAHEIVEAHRQLRAASLGVEARAADRRSRASLVEVPPTPAPTAKPKKLLRAKAAVAGLTPMKVCM